MGGTLEGRVEICINNAWGTVCDRQFGIEDAGVACLQAGGFYRNGMFVVPLQQVGLVLTSKLFVIFCVFSKVINLSL